MTVFVWFSIHKMFMQKCKLHIYANATSYLFRGPERRTIKMKIPNVHKYRVCHKHGNKNNNNNTSIEHISTPPLKIQCPEIENYAIFLKEKFIEMEILDIFLLPPKLLLRFAIMQRIRIHRIICIDEWLNLLAYIFSRLIMRKIDIDRCLLKIDME